MNEDQQNWKFYGLSCVTCCGLLTCCLFLIYVYWIYQHGKINQIEWEMATITAQDYTVERSITKKEYDEWYKTEY